MSYKRLFGVLLVVTLLTGVATWGTTLAESPVHEPPPSPKGDASSLIVGVPFEDVGSIQSAGVIDTIMGVSGWGLRPDASDYFSQANDNAGTPEKNDQYGIMANRDLLKLCQITGSTIIISGVFL